MESAGYGDSYFIGTSGNRLLLAKSFGRSLQFVSNVVVHGVAQVEPDVLTTIIGGRHLDSGCRIHLSIVESEVNEMSVYLQLT